MVGQKKEKRVILSETLMSDRLNVLKVAVKIVLYLKVYASFIEIFS